MSLVIVATNNVGQKRLTAKHEQLFVTLSADLWEWYRKRHTGNLRMRQTLRQLPP